MEFALRTALKALPPLDSLQRACVEQVRANVISDEYNITLEAEGYS